jgi:hypothetical protein
MKPKLVPEAWTVLRHSWSVRIMAICVIFILLEQPLTDGLQFYLVGYSWWLREAVNVAIAAVGLIAIAARGIFQQKLQEKVTTAKVRRQIRARYDDTYS